MSYGEYMAAFIRLAMNNCAICIKTHKLWHLWDLSSFVFFQVNTCHEKDLSVKNLN